MKLIRRAKNIIAVGGGKGGVGKSIFSISLAADLARGGSKVVLADFDLGSANLHVYLNADSRYSLSNFFHNDVDSLEALISETSVKNLGLISGSEFMVGAANPAYWLKLKLIRHIKNIDADFVIIDLGAGVHFNVLDLFAIADKGIVVTTPEPGAVINAYSFIKGALFRKIEVVFRQHRQINAVLSDLMEKGDSVGNFSLKWLGERIREIDADMFPLVEEISDWFRPSLVVNMMSDNGGSLLINNLKTLCSKELGLDLMQIGSVPEMDQMSKFLLNIPALLHAPQGAMFSQSISKIGSLIANEARSAGRIESDFDDDLIGRIMEIVDGVNGELLDGRNKNLLKLRLFFKPVEVVNFLLSKGIKDDALLVNERSPW